MGQQLSMLDTMFLELEQIDESAHMHIGAALIFDPLPGDGTPDIAVLRDHMRARVGVLPRFAQQLSGSHAGPLTWLTWEPAGSFDLDAHVHHAALPAPGGEAELYDWLGEFWSHRLDRHRPLWEMTLLDGLEGRALGAGKQDAPLPGRRRRVARHRAPAARRLPGRSAGRAAAAHGEQDGDQANGRFWLSPGLILRGARAGIGAATHPRESFDRARAAVELVVRERGHRRAADEPQRAHERHPAVRHRATGPRRRQGG